MRARRTKDGVGIRLLGRLVVAVLLVSGFVVVGGAAPAAACSCGWVDGYQPIDHADVVFSGRLVEVRSSGSRRSGSTSDPERFVFDVERVFTGEARARQSVVTALHGASCGLEISGTGPFLVVATHEPTPLGPHGEPGELHANLCGGTRPLADAPIPETLGAGWPPAPGSSPIGGDGGGSGIALFLAGGFAIVALGLSAWLVTAHRRRSHPIAV